MKKVSFLSIAMMSSLLMLGTLANAAGEHVRGELKSLENGVAVVENSAGQRVQVTMKEGYGVLLYKDITVADIPDNAYISVPSIPLAEGKVRALGVNVFPEAMRGFNECFSDWDLSAGSKMTNATLAQVVSAQGGKSLKVRFGDELQDVVVGQSTPITIFDLSPGYELKVGQLVVIFTAEKDNKPIGKFIGVRENGELPSV